MPRKGSILAASACPSSGSEKQKGSASYINSMYKAFLGKLFFTIFVKKQKFLESLSCFLEYGWGQEIWLEFFFSKRRISVLLSKMLWSSVSSTVAYFPPSGWSVLLSRKALKKASKQLKEMCPFHSDVPSILSACLVSMEPDPALRLFHDQVWPLTKFFLSAFCKKNPLILP